MTDRAARLIHWRSKDPENLEVNPWEPVLPAEVPEALKDPHIIGTAIQGNLVAIDGDDEEWWWMITKQPGLSNELDLAALHADDADDGQETQH